MPATCWAQNELYFGRKASTERTYSHHKSCRWVQSGFWQARKSKAGFLVTPTRRVSTGCFPCKAVQHPLVTVQPSSASSNPRFQTHEANEHSIPHLTHRLWVWGWCVLCHVSAAGPCLAGVCAQPLVPIINKGGVQLAVSSEAHHQLGGTWGRGGRAGSKGGGAGKEHRRNCVLCFCVCHKPQPSAVFTALNSLEGVAWVACAQAKGHLQKGGASWPSAERSCPDVLCCSDSWSLCCLHTDCPQPLVGGPHGFDAPLPIPTTCTYSPKGRSCPRSI